jgi:hypothetical protein
MRTPVVVTLASLMIALALAVPAAAAPLPPGPVNQCGTLQSYAAVDPSRLGSASAQFAIDGTTYTIALSPPGGPTYRQTSEPAAKTVGTRVCLAGTIVASDVMENVLGDLTLVPATNSGQLPSTSTDPGANPANVSFLVAFGLTAIGACVFTLLQRSRNRPADSLSR